MTHHLHETERAVAAANLANLPNGHRPFDGAVTQHEAARLLNISRRSIRRALRVRQQGAPALVKLVDGGEVRVGAADDLLRLPRSRQEEIACAGPAAVKNAASVLRKIKLVEPGAEGERLEEIYFAVICRSSDGAD